MEKGAHVSKGSHAVREESPQRVPALIRAFESGETNRLPAHLSLTKEEEYLTQIAFLKKVAKELEDKLRATEVDLRATREERDQAFEQVVRKYNDIDWKQRKQCVWTVGKTLHSP